MGIPVADTPSSSRGPRLIQSVVHAHAILDCFRVDRPLLGVGEISRELGLNKATVSRLLSTLEADGFVRKEERNGRYRLGVKCWELGYRALQHVGLREAARPHLEALVREIGETAYVAVYDRGEMAYLDVVETAQPLRVRFQLGTRAPAHPVASGKVCLAFAREADLEAYLSQRLPSHGDAAALRRELAEVRAQGFAVNRGGWDPQVTAVAAPIRDHSGAVVAAVTVAGPGSRLADDRLERIIPAVVAATHRISNDLGFHGG